MIDAKDGSIIKASGIKPASFDVVKKQSYPQIDMVLSLLQKHIDAGTAITKEDICRTYAEFKTRKTGYYVRWCYKNNIWGGHKLQVEDLIKDPFIQWHSITWFKNVLGMAIIRGKLLVIPVIDINEKEISHKP